MKAILEPVARMPGVRTVALITPDGVPITAEGRFASRSGTDSHERDALAALAAGWVGDVNRAVAPLAWDAPRHLVLRAARGTLVAMQAPGALLVVVLEGGTSAAELRLPMEAAVGRMLRHLRNGAARNAAAGAAPAAAPRAEPPPALPAQARANESDLENEPACDRISHGAPDEAVETSGDRGPSSAGE